MQKNYIFQKSFIILFLILLSATSFSQTTVIENFEEAWFPPDNSWTLVQDDINYPWIGIDASVSPLSNPSCSPHGGTGVMEFNSYFATAGLTAQIITPKVDLSQRALGAASVSFWMYRDNGWSSCNDKIDVYINTAANLTGATLLGSVSRYYATSGWYQYTYAFPGGFNTATNYLIFKATGAYGNNIFIDDIQWTTYPSLAQRQPFGMFWGYERSAAIYTPGSFGKIKDLKWNISSLTSACTGNVKIYLKQTAASTFASSDLWANVISGATLVYDGTPTFATGWNTFTLTSPNFNYSADNLMVLVETNYGNYGGESYDSKAVVYTSVANTQQKWFKDYSPPLDNGIIDANRPSMQFTIYVLPSVSLTSPADLAYLATNGSYAWQWSSSGTPAPTNSLVVEGTTKYTGTANSSTQTTASTDPTTSSYTWSVTSDNTYSPSSSASRTYYRYKTITPTTTYQTESFALPSTSSSFFYKVDLTSGNNYIFATCNHNHNTNGASGGSATFDTKIELFNSGFSSITVNDDCGGGGTQSYIDYTCTTSGSYYVKVYGFSGAFGNFTMGYKKYTSTSLPNGIWTGATNTDWFTTTNWTNNFVPTYATNVTIPVVVSTNYPSIVVGGADATHIGGLSVNSTTYTDGTMAKCLSLNIMAGASVTVNRTSGAYHQIIVENSSLIVSGTLNHQCGGNSNWFIINSGGSINVNNGGILNIGSSAVVSGNPGGTLNAYNDVFINGGVLNINDGATMFVQDALNITSGTYNQIGSSSVAKIALNGIGSAADKLAVSSGAAFNMSNGTFGIYGDNDGAALVYDAIYFASGSTANITGGTIELQNDGVNNYNATISVAESSIAFYNLTINKSGKTAYIDGYNISVNGNLLISAGSFDGSSKTITVGGNWTNNSAYGAFAYNTSTVVLTGASKVITGTASTQFKNLTLNSGSSYTISPSAGCNGTYVRGNLLVNSSSTLTINSTFLLDFYGSSVTINGSVIAQDANNTAAPADPEATGRDFDINNSASLSGTGTVNVDLRIWGGTTTLTSDLILDGNIIIRAAATFLMTSNTMTCKGNFTNSGTYTCGTGTVILSGNTKYLNGTNASTFYNLVFPLNSQYSINPVSASPTYVTGYFTVEGNSQSASNATITLETGKILGLNGTANNTINGLVKAVDVFDATRDIGMNGNPGVLQGGGIINADLQVSSNKTILGSDFNLDGNFIIASGATFEMNAAALTTLNLSGNWTNSGTLNRGIGTVVFDGSLDRTIDAGCTRGYATSATKDFYNIKINCATGKKVGLINTSLTIRNNLDIFSGSLSTDNGLCAVDGLPATNENIGATNFINQVLYVKGNTTIYDGANLYIGYQCVGARTDEGLTWAPPLQCTNVPSFEHNITVHGTITTNRPVVSGYADIFVRGSKVTGDGDANEFGVDIQPVDGFTAVQEGLVDIQGDLIIQSAVGNTWQSTNPSDILIVRGNLYIYRNFEHHGTVNVYGNMTHGSSVNDNLTLSDAIFNFYHMAGANRYISMTNTITFGWFNVKTFAGGGTRELRQNIIVNNDLTNESGRTLDTYAAGRTITLGGSWTNSGTFIEGSSTVTLNGTGGQNITSGTEQFYNLVTNKNSNSTTLLDACTVSNTLTLTKGLINTGTNKLICTNTAKDAGTSNCLSISPLNYTNKASYINGNFRQSIAASTASEGYLLPVGTATAYRLARFISPATAVTGISYVDANFMETYTSTGSLDASIAKDLGTPYASICTEGIWHIKGDANPASGAYDLMLFFDDGGGTNAFSGLTSGQFGILKRPDGSSTADAWTAVDGTISSSTAAGNGRIVADGYARRYGMTSFSEQAIAESAVTLPVSVINFDAKLRGSVVDIFWTTVSETNSDYFVVEKSTDMNKFEEVKTVKAAGFSNQIINYFVVDENPYEGISYYRLKEVDMDGTINYVGIAKVIYNKSSKNSKTATQNQENSLQMINLFPNPTSNQINIVFSALGNEKTIILVFDIQGKVMLSMERSDIIEGNNIITLNASNLPQGIYFINVISASGKAYGKFIKAE